MIGIKQMQQKYNKYGKNEKYLFQIKYDYKFYKYPFIEDINKN